jgi:hypothetical protein
MIFLDALSFRYQLAIGGVTEAQAAPSATMGGAKTALIGATQNAAQIATGTGHPLQGGPLQGGGPLSLLSYRLGQSLTN